jgi:ferric enterobactin receptor
VENKDINAMLRFTPVQGQRIDIEGGYSRQGNEYAGEYRLGGGSSSPNVAAMIGEETNTVKRATASLNYQGDFSFGTAKLIAQYEHTKNRRLNEGLAGSSEGTFSTTTTFSTSTLKNWYVNTSLDLPFETGGITHVATVGGEFRNEYLNDPFAMSQGLQNTQQIPGAESGTRDPSSSASTYAGFIEDNILFGPVTVTPGVRFDHHSTFGSNWSPSLNLSVAPIPHLTFKGGIARAFKAPNLYQSNPNYLYFTMGNGCPLNFANLGGGCYVQGNADLDAEISVNKEIGVAYAPEGWNISATYFRNDYKNKIIASNVPVGNTTGGTTVGRIFQWYNAPKAVVEGVEGNILVPLHKALNFNTNVTYMIQNKNKTTGERLSIIPKYTINSTLDVQVSEQVSFLLTFTRYGKQVPNRVLYSGSTPTEDQLRPRPAYNQVGINANFRVNKSFRLGAGVSNLFDKKFYRESSNNAQGANNYNEPGRAFFVTSTASF